MIISNAKFNNYPKAQPYSKKARKLGFSSELLYRVQIKQLDKAGRETFIPAKVTEIVAGFADSLGMLAINQKWSKTELTEYIVTDYQYIRDKFRFLALEIEDDTKKLEDRVLCLAEVTSNAVHSGHNDMEVNYIQAGPESEYGKNRKYKGAGEVLLAKICQFARQLGFSEVTLNSTNDHFYNHIKMPPAPDLGDSYYAFKKGSMTRFMKRTDKKYHINEAA